MAGMYPKNEEVTIFGEKVQWPGVDKNGKFTNGSFSDPHEPPSFIPANTINLILDNLSGLITKLGGKPDNSSVEQLAGIFTSEVKANTGIVRDAAGRAKVAAPVEADDIARKAEVDEEIQARTQGDSTISGQLSSHAGNKSNPHGVSKEQLGLGNVDNTADKDKSVKYAASARHSDTSNLLQAYTTDDYAGGNHFIKAIRESGWNMRLYGCYFNGAKQADCVKVNYANSAGKAATADSAKNADAVGGYRAGNGVNMLVPVVAFNVGENAGYIKLGNGLIVQWGITRTNSSDTQKVQFASAFNSAPAVFLTPRFDESGIALVVQAYKIMPTQFVCNCKNANENTYYPRLISWLAIGF